MTFIQKLRILIHIYTQRKCFYIFVVYNMHESSYRRTSIVRIRIPFNSKDA